MTDPPKYRVILSGNLLPEKSRAEVIDKLALLFHSRLETASKLLQGKAVPMTKEYPRDQAEKICRAIRAAGAECRMEEIGAPAAPTPTPPDAAAVEDDSATRRRTEAGEDETADADEEESVADADEEESAAAADEDEPTADADEDESDAEDETADADEDEPATAEEKHAGATGRESALLGFVAVNTDYYGRQFAKFGDAERSSFALSWHWPAFFVFFFWAVYRKLWLWAGVNLAGGVVLALTVKPGFVYLAWALFWPLTANYLYFRHARNRVFQNAPGVDGDGEPAPGGGVSRAAVWLGMVVMFLFSAGLNDLITEKMLAQYSERVGNALPDPGSRQRGDGSAIDDLTTLAPKVAETVAMLGVLTTGFKLAASAKGLEDSQQALSAFGRAIEEKGVKDAWGKRIVLRQDATGQVVLRSAGPDGRFDNGDDVLQYIRFDDSDGL